MLTLPLNLITKEDKYLVGEDIYNLAKLQKHNFPVASGIVVFPPDFSKIFDRLNIKTKEDFERNYNLLKKLVQEIIIYPELEIKLKQEIKVGEIKKVWGQLIDNWLEKLGKNLNAPLAQVMFYTEKISASGTIYLDKNKDLEPYVSRSLLHYSYILDSKIEVNQGVLSPLQMQKLENLAEKMDKLLGISQTYHFIIENASSEDEIKIIRVTPSTVISDLNEKQYKNVLNNVLFINRQIKSEQETLPLKVFISTSTKPSLNIPVDGFWIDSGSFKNDEEKSQTLKDIAKHYCDKTIIFKLDELEEDAKTVLNLRNKDKFFNLSVAISNCKSIFELIQVKRELASLGLARKGSLKFWFELTTPENLLNIEEYVKQGLDGVLVNLDQLLIKLNDEKEHLHYNDSQINALLKFLEEGIRTLHKLQIPIICLGQLAAHDDVVRFLINKGIYAVVIKSDTASPMYQDLLWNQKYAHRNLLA